MKSELDALRERGEEVIRAADPASPIFTPRHAAALCGFFVEALEEQRRWMQQAVAGGGQKWATVQQLAEHGIIHFSIGKWGNQSRAGSGENSFFHKLIPPCQYMPGNGILSVAKISGLGYTRTSIKNSMQKTERIEEST